MAKFRGPAKDRERYAAGDHVMYVGTGEHGRVLSTFGRVGVQGGVFHRVQHPVPNSRVEVYSPAVLEPDKGPE